MDYIDIEDLRLSFMSYVNSNVGGWYRPQSDFQLGVNVIQNELWNELTARAEKSNEDKDNLRNFLRSKNCQVAAQKGGYGFFEEPKDYGRFASIRIMVESGKKTVEGIKDETGDIAIEEKIIEEAYSALSEVEVKPVDNVRWASCLDHKTKMPTLKNPKSTQIKVGEKTGWKVAPREISVVVLDYYVKPQPIFYAYDKTAPNLETGDGDEIKYNQLQSKQLLWPSTLMNEFVIRLGSRYGLFTRDQFMAQFNLQKQK